MVVVGLLLIPINCGVMLWMPRLLGDMIDILPKGGTTEALANTCFLLLGLAIAEALTRFTSRKLLVNASRMVEQSLKDEMTAHLQRLPIAWFDKSRTGDITSRMTQDVEMVRFVMGPMLLHGGTTICLLPAGMVLMLQMDVAVALASLAALLTVFVSMKFILPRLHKWSKKSQEAIAGVSQQAQEDFAGVRVVQQFDITDRELAAMATKNRRYLLANLRLVRLRSLMNALTHSSTGFVMLGVLLVGGHQVITGRITVGQLFQFTMYLGLMTFPLQILGWTVAMLPRAYASAIRIEEIFEAEPEPQTGAQPELRGAIKVCDLTFTYPDADKPALEGVSFVLEPGQKLGMIGPVGCGKSTLLSLLLRYYDPPRGTMFVDGHDVLDLAPGSLRKLFALAPQEPFLFSDTVTNNITFDDSDIDLQQRDAAVAAAALDQDLPQLIDGIDTIVGERGVTLSGGQKQRVSLARAVLSDRPGMLLDDTLSAVDPSTERRILDGLNDSRRGRTVIATTHRLSVTANADLILVLDHGKIKERGTHDDLVQRGELYAKAWRLQTEARALETDSDDAEQGSR
ncbi:MAG: ATP-binding cassette subfamily B multidrug efflux pump [Hyphomicrobiaceae bacterium]|jgi:ATP-binding cassette subfamily B multidrug efflux pump